MYVVYGCFVLFAVFNYGDCTVTGWTSPFGTTAILDAGMVYMSDVSTGTIYTFTPTLNSATVNSIAILTQTVTDFFEFASPTDGLLTLKGSNVLDSSASTTLHVLTIKAIDSASLSGTVTLSIKIRRSEFLYGSACTNVDPNTAVGTTLLQNAVTAQDSVTYALTSGNTNTDYIISSSTGDVTLGKAFTSTSGDSNGAYVLTITGTESVGTASTATSYMTMCLYERGCSCHSSAVVITAGMMSLAGLLVAMLEKYI